MENCKCGMKPLTAIRGVQKRIEAAIWCPDGTCQGIKMIVVPCENREFTTVQNAMDQAIFQWDNSMRFIKSEFAKDNGLIIKD